MHTVLAISCEGFFNLVVTVNDCDVSVWMIRLSQDVSIINGQHTRQDKVSR